MNKEHLVELLQDNYLKLKVVREYNSVMKNKLGIYWSELVLSVMEDRSKMLNMLNVVKEDRQIDYSNYILDKNAYPYPRSYFMKYVLPQLLKTTTFIC